MNAGTIHLKIKIKTLSAEATFIRREEVDAKFRSRARGEGAGEVYGGLHAHRILVVRRACRSAGLAYALLRGRAYATVEASCHSAPSVNDVRDNVSRFGGVTKEDAETVVKSWLKGEIIERFKPARREKPAALAAE